MKWKLQLLLLKPLFYRDYYFAIWIVISDLLRNIRTQVLIKLIKPYTRIHIPFISKELNIDAGDVEALLVSCILDRYANSWINAKTLKKIIRRALKLSSDFSFYSTIRGKIDQVNQVLELSQVQGAGSARYTALDKWTVQLSALHNSIVSKI